MALPHKPLPKRKIQVIHGGTTYELQDYTLSFDVFLPENAVSQALLTLTDTEGEIYSNKAAARDEIKIYVDYTNATTKVFGGFIRECKPSLGSRELVVIKANGYGEALVNMLCGQQYGSESSNSSLNTLQEILTDSTDGIIPDWVNKILSGPSSGYDIKMGKVGNVTSDLRYLYFPYKPALNCIKDVCDLVTAAGAGSTAGPHFIVNPIRRLCVATIANHENPPSDVWPTWFNTDQAGSTIEVKKDMIVSEFRSLECDANYVLYHGLLRKPVEETNGWCENNAASWGSVDATLSNESGAGLYKTPGSYSLKAQTDDATAEWYYPSTTDLNLDITAVGGQYNIPTLNFWVRINNTAIVDFWLYLFTTYDTDYYRTLVHCPGAAYPHKEVPDDDTWYYLKLPIGPYWKSAVGPFWGWLTGGSPNWNDIDAIGFMCEEYTYIFYLDHLHVAGHVLRAAYNSTLYGTDKPKIKLINDNVPKDDSLKAADDSGVMAQMAYAELLKAQTKPVVGQIVIPGKESIQGGQLCHVHFGEKSDGTFNVDSDMRVLQHRLHFDMTGLRSYLDLTDDVKNTSARGPMKMWNLLKKARGPAFTDRETSSIKAHEIDITQTILSKDYP